MLNTAWYRTIGVKEKKKKKIVPKPLMVPEANKQQQRSTAATLWTRLAFICRRSSKLRAMRRTNWQSKLMCNWAVVHFTGPVVSSAGGDHTQAPLSHHNG